MIYLEGTFYYLPDTMIGEVVTGTGAPMFWFEKDLLNGLARYLNQRAGLILDESQLLKRWGLSKPEPRLIAVGDPDNFVYLTCMACEGSEVYQGKPCPQGGEVWHIRMVMSRKVAP